MYLVVHEDREGRERCVPRTFYTEGSARAYVERDAPAALSRGDAIVLYECRTKDVLREGTV